MRSFDPVRVGRLECDAWVAYYRRRWLSFLRAAVSLTRETFALSWPATLRGAWLVLRANQLWAPVPGNDPEGARRCMAEFYRLLGREHCEVFDPEEAARLEVEWWRLHRELPVTGEAGQVVASGTAPGGQPGSPGHPAASPAPGHGDPALCPEEAELSGAIARLYSHVYGVEVDRVKAAAELRALAMRHSDRWVREGRDAASPLVATERRKLVSSYTHLLAAIQFASSS